RNEPMRMCLLTQSVLLFAACASLFAVSSAIGSELEAQVAHRAEQLEKAKQDFDEAAAEFSKSPAHDQLADLKARYVLKQWQALRDAESRKERAEDLLASQRRLMAEARQEIEQVVARSPEIRKLQDVGARASREAIADAETRRRIVEVIDAVQK